MQAGGGRRDRAVLTGIHCLVALFVKGLVIALDIRRQRHMAVLCEQRLWRRIAVKLQHIEIPLTPDHLDRLSFGAFHY